MTDFADPQDKNFKKRRFEVAYRKRGVRGVLRTKLMTGRRANMEARRIAKNKNNESVSVIYEPKVDFYSDEDK